MKETRRRRVRPRRERQMRLAFALQPRDTAIAIAAVGRAGWKAPPLTRLRSASPSASCRWVERCCPRTLPASAPRQSTSPEPGRCNGGGGRNSKIFRDSLRISCSMSGPTLLCGLVLLKILKALHPVILQAQNSLPQRDADRPNRFVRSAPSAAANILRNFIDEAPRQTSGSAVSLMPSNPAQLS